MGGTSGAIYSCVPPVLHTSRVLTPPSIFFSALAESLQANAPSGGAADAALNSFEAMWELAELLGQAKPPTATRADIARAGLAVLRPAALARLRDEGRVVDGACAERVSALSFYGCKDGGRGADGV